MSRFPALLAALAFLALCAPCLAGGLPTQEVPLVVDKAAGSVSFLAEVNPAMADSAIQHFAVWKGGAYADKALFKGFIAPESLFDALASLGFTPGDNMTMENWGHERVLGEKLVISVRFIGPEGSSPPVDMAALLRDEGGRGLDMRFGGNRKAATAKDSSGCLICLFSCPMGIVSNHETFFKETGWWGSVRYRAMGLPAPGGQAVITIRRR